MLTRVSPMRGAIAHRAFLPRAFGLPRVLSSASGDSAPEEDENAPMARLLRQNKEFAKQMKQKDGLLESFKSHKPDILWIGCSDARVPANDLLGEGPGKVFVHRNVANLVVNTDVNLMSVLQYAVTVLKVKDIVVCGHYECGGVRAAMEQRDHQPPLENWLRNIRDVVRLHKSELMAITDQEQRYRRLVELNTIEQSLNVFKTGSVQEERIKSRKANTGRCAVPRVHAFVYDPLSVELMKLPVDFKKALSEHESVYNLYQVPGK